jgi:hypothetical protein
VRHGNPKTDLYWKLKKRQKACCYICELPEYEYGKHFDMHRLVSGKNGGEYIEENVLLMCRKCHRKAEGMTRSQIDTVAQFFTGTFIPEEDESDDPELEDA